MTAHEHLNMPLLVFRYCFIVNQNINSKIHSSGRNKRDPSHTFSEVNRSLSVYLTGFQEVVKNFSEREKERLPLLNPSNFSLTDIPKH